CRAWRMCVTACPYKKSYYNWNTGKSEKCILCYPRLEAGFAPACMHSCVGRIRYLGVMLYDADKIKEAASAPEDKLIQSQLDIILDPFDEMVIQYAKENGIADSTIKAAQTSPVYKFVKVWGLGLPLHPEFRTLPMLFYVPSLLPVMATLSDTDNTAQAGKLDPIAKFWNRNTLYNTTTDALWGTIEEARFPIKYMANMFGVGNEEIVKEVLKKQLAVRIHRRNVTVGDVGKDFTENVLKDVNLTSEMADDIYNLTSLAKFDDRFNIPPAHREQALDMLENSGDLKGSIGFGFKEKPVRGL
ncbi:MAG: 4Fe-4S dicluster domain-containing protein, partial [Ignavibacteriota bacterium]